jgi:hypothetical protein
MMDVVPLEDAEHLADRYVRAVWSLRDRGAWDGKACDANNLDDTWEWCLAIIVGDIEDEAAQRVLAEAMALRLEGR